MKIISSSVLYFEKHCYSMKKYDKTAHFVKIASLTRLLCCKFLLKTNETLELIKIGRK